MCNKIKTKIKSIKRAFFRRALTSNRPKEPRNIIHRILYPSPQSIKVDPDALNNLRPVTHSEIMRMLTTMKSDCSTAADQIPVKYLKLSADVIASPLTHILNSFISISSFPEAWRVARVLPIPKVKLNVIITDLSLFYEQSLKSMKNLF